MAGGGDPAVIARWRELVLKIGERRRRGDLGKIVLVFADLVGRRAAWKSGLEGFDMTESQVVNEWIAEAEEKRDLEVTRRLLLRLLHKRFPEQVPPEVVETINTQPSLTMLEDWFDQAQAVASLADFIRILRA